MKNNHVKSASLLFAIAGALALSACNKPEEPVTPPPSTAPMSTPATTPAVEPATPPAAAAPVSVSSVDLGKAVGPDQKVTDATTTFAPKDTIYAAVSTSGAASNATLNAKFTFQDGQTVNDSSQTIAPSGGAVTAFHISKPDGWPVGNYKVEISLNGTQVATKDFTVK